MKARVVARTMQILGALVFGASVISMSPGCGKKSGDAAGEKAGDESLPPLKIGDDTPNLMLTWIDGRGGTHVEVSPNRVPDEGRRLVRVIVTGQDKGMSDPIYVADLTSKSTDGTYDTHSMTRHEWENEIERRRGAMAALPEEQGGRPVPRSHPGPGPGPGQGAPDPQGDDQGPGPNGDALKGVTVTIYGASWCGPCHMALDHLKRLHVATNFKDIDKDPGAGDEMREKLAKVGQRAGSIPVIDVGGRILVGYDQRALDQALERAAGGTAL